MAQNHLNPSDLCFDVGSEHDSQSDDCTTSQRLTYFNINSNHHSHYLYHHIAPEYDENGQNEPKNIDIPKSDIETMNRAISKPTLITLYLCLILISLFTIGPTSDNDALMSQIEHILASNPSDNYGLDITKECKRFTKSENIDVWYAAYDDNIDIKKF